MNEAIHQIVVSGGDDHQVVPVVLHGLEDGVDGLLAEVVPRGAVQGIGLVDEQHAPQGLFHGLSGLQRRLAHVARHQPGPVHLHQLPLGEDAQGVEDPGHQPGDGGFSGAGTAGEDHVEGQLRHRQAVFLPELVDLYQINEVSDLLFYGGKADVAVQLLLQILQLLRRRSLLLGLGTRACGLGGLRSAGLPLGGGRGFGGILGWGLRRFDLWGQGGAPEIRSHPAEVVLRQGLDDLQLLEDDFVLFVLLVHTRQPFIKSVCRSPRNRQAEASPVSPPVSRDTASKTGR